ncbi:MAG: UvrD-helicase domain-containing protein [Candidatus Dadabacteria bacterium]|nr:UvrD-helicase domain-containing protein [Candidatus Dadabacteria bacterium]MDE0663044.1 UvrD-helicase domain-containing protein [Candidatus Dadabacteria bacterium]
MSGNSLKGLNPSQLEAVTHGEGPLLVLAGPGSGKTRVIAHRIAYLINDLSVPPGNILAVTFTNKAAAEMKKRARDLAGELASGIWIGTFHSICLRILKIEADFLEGHTKDFVVYDQDDQLGLLKSCLKELDYGESLFSPKGVLSEFDAAENREGASFRDDFYGRRLSELYDFYKKELVKRNAMTFNDLLLLANRLLSENQGVCVRYQDRFSQVLVDEYQDTNVSQYRFAKTLSQRHRNLFVVGDDSQSIYGWRGADINNILNFEKDFPGARVVKLERNYRSTLNILGIANSVIRKNPGRKEKTLWTENPEGERALVFKALDNADEARFVAERISDLAESGDFKWSDVAIFYRANFQSRVIEEGLRVAKVPYRIVSGVGFYQRAEIKDVIAYLRLVQNPRDDVSFLRIVNVPPRKIGGVTLRKLREASQAGGFALFEASEYCQEHDLLPAQALGALSRFLEIIKGLGSAAESRPVAQVIKNLLQSTAYLDYLGDDHQRAENVRELLNAAEEWDDITLSDFLDLVLLATDEDRGDSGEEKVSLMTIHAAKGLEFPAVFVVGVNEDLLPHRRSAETLGGLEEERRLFYVAVTRAKRLLYLSYASLRTASGGTYHTRRSAFLDDLSPEHVVCESRKKKLSGRDSDLPSEEKTYELEDVGLNLRPGQRVTHHVFGPGVVKRIDGKGDRAVATVDFFGSGVKKILASFFAD